MITAQIGFVNFHLDNWTKGILSFAKNKVNLSLSLIYKGSNYFEVVQVNITYELNSSDPSWMYLHSLFVKDLKQREHFSSLNWIIATNDPVEVIDLILGLKLMSTRKRNKQKSHLFAKQLKFMLSHGSCFAVIQRKFCDLIQVITIGDEKE